ncbi:MAG: hypothetical protein M1821_001130 [Bathelium mastoideum]|nr:MAG: hypothetical protein M1821_001130 [Bathelium mastoideum]
MSMNRNVIALISGGKDSIYSIYHCLARGHTVVALANLFPAGDGKSGEDIDSFMYQTVGHSVVPLYEGALQLPLYRTQIKGTAVNASKYYHLSPETLSANGDSLPDETESLLYLLEKVKTAHPQANAICTGAILSDYQRSRVESVAFRLGLQSLAYLWQYPCLPPHTQTSLLEDMETVHHGAIIIKVASGGLDESFLGHNVADSRTIERLRRALGKFGPLQGGSVLGEGGEYETLSINGPDDVWRQYIDVGFNETKATTGEGGTAALSIKHPKLTTKQNVRESGPSALRIPDDLDAEFGRLKQDLQKNGRDNLPKNSTREGGPIVVEVAKKFSISRAKDLLYINNLSIPTDDKGRRDVRDQIRIIIEQLASLLQEENLTNSDIISSTLILRSMSDFQIVNTVYGAFFSKPQPPSRITIACGANLPEDIDVTLSVVANRLDPSFRHGLHVQSISYWAPANIGPYSQAVGIASQTQLDSQQGCELVYTAGQIPLVPATMMMINKGQTWDEFREQTVLSLQHLWRVGRAMSVDNWLVGIAFVASPSRSQEHARNSMEELVRIATAAWQILHENSLKRSEHQEEDSDDDVDVWDQKYGPNRHSNLASLAELDTRHPLPNLARVGSKAWMNHDNHLLRRREITPPCFVVEVDELPREARIEWTSIGVANGNLEVGASSASQAILRPGNLVGQILGPLKDSQKIECYWSWNEQSGYFFVWVGVDNIKETSVNTLYREILHTGVVPTGCTVYAAQDLPQSFEDGLNMQVIPCRSVWDQGGKRLEAVLSFRVQEESTIVESSEGT